MTDNAHMNRIGTISAFLVLLAVMLQPLQAQAGYASAPFSAGTARLSLFAGGATAFDRNYSIFGFGFGYYVMDGVEVGLEADTWSGNTPRIQEVSPQVRLVLNTRAAIKPYVGAYVRRTFIDGYANQDTVGWRAGGYFLTGQSAYFGVGLAQDTHLACDRTTYAACTETYPELLFAIVF